MNPATLDKKAFQIYADLHSDWHALFGKFGFEKITDAKHFPNRVVQGQKPSRGFSAPSGFKDFAGNLDFGQSGVYKLIEPGRPASSVLFHALASPAVILPGLQADQYPTESQIETIEDYVYALAKCSLAEIRAKTRGAPLAVVVFSKQYRTISETTHHKSADFVFSRIGVARIGNDAAKGKGQPTYSPLKRCFSTQSGEPHVIHPLPCRYSAYIAAKVNGDQDKLIPGRFLPADPQSGDGDQQGDDSLDFWIPVHKVFSGPDCLVGFNLDVKLEHSHINEKLRRIHRALEWLGIDSGRHEPEISQPPFVESDLLGGFDPHPDGGSALLVPMNKIVEPVRDKKGLYATMFVPPNEANEDSSFHIYPRPERWAAEFVYVRQKFDGETVQYLGDSFDVSHEVRKGNYRAIHYRDFTGDGWVRADCPQLAKALLTSIAAYSIVAPPDLMPGVRQAELMDWYSQSAPADIGDNLWLGSSPQPLCDQREPANLSLPGGGFSPDDVTLPALVAPWDSPKVDDAGASDGTPEIKNRTTPLPDAASGIFAPGSEIGQDQTPGFVTEDGALVAPVDYLSHYGMGSPFLEDTKLCAAQSSFWPGTTPDTARVFEPYLNQPSVTPLLDTELDWDGSQKPEVIQQPGNNRPGIVLHRSRAHADYVYDFINTPQNFKVNRLAEIDLDEYVRRTVTMARTYLALDAPSALDKSFWVLFSFARLNNKTLKSDVAAADNLPASTLARVWKNPSLLSLSRLTAPRMVGNAECLAAVQRRAEDTYRMELYRHTGHCLDPQHHGMFQVMYQEMILVYANPNQVFIKRDGYWDRFDF